MISNRRPKSVNAVPARVNATSDGGDLATGTVANDPAVPVAEPRDELVGTRVTGRDEQQPPEAPNRAAMPRTNRSNESMTADSSAK